MIKRSFLLLVLIILSCTKNDVFETENQIIINPIAKCENGFAGEYPCNDYDLLTHITLEEIGDTETTGSNCWGWVDPISKKEYALMGTNQGVTFIDISNPKEAIILGTLKTKTVDNPKRDIKVHNSIAYIVSEAEGHGMQMFNLGRLKDVKDPPVEFTSDREYEGFGSANSIVINEKNSFGYALGTKTFSGGPHFMDLNVNFKPKAVGGFSDNSYANEAQVVTYTGPDSDYFGKEILIGSNSSEVVLVDITDKENPKKITSFTYTNIGYTHRGLFTEDFRYFIFGDELDEINNGVNTRTIVYDFTDLDNPVHHFDYEGSNAAIDHNGYIKGNFYYQANYTNGVRIIDISNIENKTFSEVGFFDTYPKDNATETNGAWNVYPFLPSGNIIVSDFNNGFFVIRKSKS